MDHGGGVQLDEGSDDYKALVELMDRIENGDSCSDTQGSVLADVQVASSTSTLRRAALDLVGRLPTKAEKDAVQKGGDAALDKALDAMMKEDAFYDRLREIWNDTLLTDKYLSYGGAAIDLMNTEQYPWLGPYRDDNKPEYLMDQTMKRWSTGKGQAGDEWVQVDLGVTAAVRELSFTLNPDDAEDYPRIYQIRISDEPLDFNGPIRASGSGLVAQTLVVTLAEPVQGRYLLVQQKGKAADYWWSISELTATCF